MNFAVELCFDEQTEARVRDLWERIEAAGLPSRLLEFGHTPHVSLGVCAELDHRAFAPKLGELAATEPRLHATLISLGTFANREGVVFLGLINTPELLALHARVDALFAAHAREPRDYYRPGRWVPHCTLTTALDPEQVAAALRVCMDVALPIQARFESIVLVENPSGAVHARAKLGGTRQA